MIVDFIRTRLRRRKKSKEWRERNRHNGTICRNEFDYDSVSIGNYTYGELTVLNFGEDRRLTIGSCCSIASGVVFNLAGDHYLNHISTFPFKSKVLGGPMREAVSKGDIVVGDDVWIGQNAIILSGITIGQGAVVAAGAVVTESVPPYAIVGGVPARIIKYRFSEPLIHKLLQIDYSRLKKEMIEEHIEELYSELTDEEQLLWMPLKKDSTGDPSLEDDAGSP